MDERPPFLSLVREELPHPSMTTTTDEKSPERRKRRPHKPNVIHVEFGNGGGRVVTEKAASGDSLDPNQPREPVTDLFSTKEVAKLLGLTEARLRSLDRAHIVSPTGSRQRQARVHVPGSHRAARHARAPRQARQDPRRRQGDRRAPPVPPQGDAPAPGAAHRERRQARGRARRGSAFEPLTGQMVLDFQVTSLRDDVVRVLRPETASQRARTAYDLYVQGEHARRGPRARSTRPRRSTSAPSTSIRRWPSPTRTSATFASAAATRRGPRSSTRQALELDPRQPEAHYNLGYVMLERGDARARRSPTSSGNRSGRSAVRRRALQPRDGATSRSASAAKARPHWKRYLELEPTGTWAEIARQHL